MERRLRRGDLDPEVLRYAVRRALGLMGNFTALHVRRGDKIELDPFSPSAKVHGAGTCFPHLDASTQPKRVVETLRRHVAPGSTVLLQTDGAPEVFEQTLASVFNVVTVSHLLERNAALRRALSVPRNRCATTESAARRDDRAEEAVCPILVTALDYALFALAEFTVDTYSDTPETGASLTNLPRHGVPCDPSGGAR